MNKRDANESAIIKILQQVGCTVQRLAESSARGVPDLLVGRAGRTYLLEVKAPKGYLSAEQVKWQAWWAGYPVREVRTEEEALAAVGLPSGHTSP